MNTQLFIQELEKKNPSEPEFIQAVKEVLESIETIYNQNPQFNTYDILERIVEPDRILVFRVPCQDDSGKVQVNRGFRIEFNAVLGPYKGGLRFHPDVSLGTFKLLGFE